MTAPAGVFEGRWPITDEDSRPSELLALARPELIVMAAKKRLLLMPETFTWEVLDRGRERPQFVVRAEAVSIDAIAGEALDLRAAS